MSDAYIVGAGMIPFGRYPDRTYFQLAAEATLMALDDCGLSIKDVGVVYASSTFNAASMLGQKMMQQIGQTGVPVINVSNAALSRLSRQARARLASCSAPKRAAARTLAVSRMSANCSCAMACFPN